ncbi:DUF2752 domain-containing protein [Streptomyces sp. JJ38]|nr:DUF2752 domain-containing protein [Streptomyces sp. JJ38]MBW1598007.1 DUF2752 domain-containing protein [Streptomyces sp. JJ38]
MSVSAPRTRRPRHPAVAPLAALAAGGAGAAYLYRTDPHSPGQFLPRCVFNWATGLDCPACGTTRMAYDLLHGDVAAAFADNAAMLVLGVPVVTYLGTRWLVSGLRGRRYRPRVSTRAILPAALLMVTWTVARNLVG